MKEKKGASESLVDEVRNLLGFGKGVSKVKPLPKKELSSLSEYQTRLVLIDIKKEIESFYNYIKSYVTKVQEETSQARKIRDKGVLGDSLEYAEKFLNKGMPYSERQKLKYKLEGYIKEWKVRINKTKSEEINEIENYLNLLGELVSKLITIGSYNEELELLKKLTEAQESLKEKLEEGIWAIERELKLAK